MYIYIHIYIYIYIISPRSRSKHFPAILITQPCWVTWRYIILYVHIFCVFLYQEVTPTGRGTTIMCSVRWTCIYVCIYYRDIGVEEGGGFSKRVAMLGSIVALTLLEPVKTCGCLFVSGFTCIICQQCEKFVWLRALRACVCVLSVRDALREKMMFIAKPMGRSILISNARCSAHAMLSNARCSAQSVAILSVWSPPILWVCVRVFVFCEHVGKKYVGGQK